MTTTEERRANGIQRVPVEALVEVCGVGAKQTPFEAESADVSGRGIRLRTAYLPEAGAPVVCRFENRGREVIAEGVVAWCQKETYGGEFGVRFTALDAQSAETLRKLCGIGSTVGDATKEALLDDVSTPRKVAPGAKVKLHIEGLGAPMRARVDDGKGSHVSVGSSLEFLRIGRKLEMESIDDGSRREARIEGLDVMIDPSSGVPRLLVLLKTDGGEDTPLPSVVDTARKQARGDEPAARGLKGEKQSSKGSKPSRGSQPSEETDEPTDEQVDAMVGGVRRIAGVTRRKLVEASIQLGRAIRPGFGHALLHARKLSRRSSEPPRRRTTAAPVPNHGSERNLRPQMRSVDSEVESPKATQPRGSLRMRRVASGVVVAGLLATVTAVAVHGPAQSSSPSTSAETTLGRQSVSTTPGNASLGTESAMNAGNNLQGNLGAQDGKLIVNVPLFGTTAMATLERAPIASASAEAPSVVAAREQALAKANQAALAAGVDSAKFSEDPGAEATGKAEEPSTKPEDVAPFGHGRMKDPILYRLKLDAPGEAIRGTSSGKGFSVMIPGRKLLESPNGFVKRDPRFQKITSSQTSDGAKLMWQFKDDAPAFRVRLRKSAVEILISEGKPSEGKPTESRASDKTR